MMKRCEVCNIDYDNGKFCKKCGAKLVDVLDVLESEVKQQDVPNINESTQKIEVTPPLTPEKSDADKLEAVNQNTAPLIENIQDVARETEVKEEKKVKKEKKEKASINVDQSNTEKPMKKSRKKIKLVLMLVLVLVLILTGGAGFYYTQSTIDMPKVGQFDYTEYTNEILTDLFSDKEFEVTIPSDAINQYIDDYLKKNATQFELLNSNISELVYSTEDNALFVQFSDGLIKSTAIMSIEISNIDNKLVYESNGVKVGSLKLPLIGSSILNMDGISSFVGNSYEFPESVKIDKVKVVKDGLQISGEFNMTYLQDSMVNVLGLTQEGFEAIGNMSESQLKVLNFLDNVEDLTETEVLEFYFNYLIDDEFASSLLATLNPESIDSATDTLNLGLFVLSDAQLSARAEKSTEINKAYEENAASEKLENERSQAIQYADDAIQALVSYHESLGTKMHLISYKGVPYSTTLQQLVSLSMLQLPSNSNFGNSAKLLIEDGNPLIAVETSQGIIVSNGSDYETFDDFNAVKTKYSFSDSTNIPTNSLLPKGNGDRTEIAKVTSSYIGSNKSIFVKYLKSDGEWAFLMCTPGSNSQEINNVILKKAGSTWQVVTTYDETFTAGSLDTSIINQGFNVTLLPPYEFGDFDNTFADASYIRSAEEYLYNNGKIKSSEKCDYFAKTGSVIAMNFETGKRFILEMDPDNTNNVVNIITLSSGDHFVDFTYILQKHFGSYIPGYVFLQN